MSVTGEIKNLYSDKDKTRVLLPRTKTKAISDENGVGLDVLLSQINTELNGKAPDGFGLGEEYPRDITCNDANRASVSGLYWINTSTANTPTSAWLGIMAVKSRSSNEKTQIIDYFADDKIYTVRRNIINDYGQPWEWVNPPMQLGVEYRTTERWNGAVVYAKLVGYEPSGTIGNTDGSTDILIPHGITGFNRLVRVDSTVFYTISLPVVDSNGFVSTEVTTVNNQNIELRINKRTWTNEHPFTFALYYTK